ncbi:MAG: TlpA family protein disulfide reductase [Alcanivoracaceae bacterium]|nr:TlpA family protein disulfide reductase [Alcanivoracaceae bacterium]
MKKIALITLVFLLTACEQSQQITVEAEDTIKTAKEVPYEIAGLWRGVLASPGGELPFGIDISKDKQGYTAKILNGEERADTSSVEFSDKTITINFEWFDARIKAILSEDGKSMSGQWSKTASGKDKTSMLPFSASRGFDYRFKQELDEAINTEATGNWEVTFSDDDGESLAVAEFSQNDQILTGTFLTPTGDYRYLAGSVNDNKLYLSAFDGAHAFLFDAEINNNKIINGNFWSRESYHATWDANKSADTSNFLPSSWEMNKITSSDNTASFSFEDIGGNTVQLTDNRFKNKPVLINLFGTWCPNCNDEAPVLAEFYDKYNPQGLEIVGLAFEFTEDPVRDKRQLTAFKKRHGINYPLLLAGGNDKAKATKILGFLDEVKSYPTTIFLDKNHQVKKIHTGFSGPGTGEHYQQLVSELENEILELIK